MVSLGRSLSDEEEALWSGVTRSITPLPHAKKRPKSPDQATVVVTRAAVSKPRAVHEVMPAVEKPQPPLAPLDRRTKQRIASGRTPIDARLDLHGFTQDGARAALTEFILNAVARGERGVLVITGKGALSDGVLRRRTPEWLAEPPLRPVVAGISEAHRRHGGAGALYVALKRQRRP